MGYGDSNPQSLNDFDVSQMLTPLKYKCHKNFYKILFKSLFIPHWILTLIPMFDFSELKVVLMPDVDAAVVVVDVMTTTTWRLSKYTLILEKNDLQKYVLMRALFYYSQPKWCH